MEFDELENRLNALDVSCLCDMDRTLPVMSDRLKPINPGLKLIGKARTVSCCDDFLTVIKGLAESKPGEVLVIDAGGGRKALAGELFSAEAKRRGLAGIIIDGACRDSRSIKEMGIPVWCTSFNPMAGTAQKIEKTQIAITCAGVQVAPGDIIFGDSDGIIAAKQSRLEALLEAAEKLKQREDMVLKQIKEGKSLIELLNFEEHFSAVAGGGASKLRFQ